MIFLILFDSNVAMATITGYVLAEITGENSIENFKSTMNKGTLLFVPSNTYFFKNVTKKERYL
jgi:hypothetical protein